MSSTLSIPETPKGIECRCDGCRRKIRSTDFREIFSAINSEGHPFVKTLCSVCVKDIVEKFRTYIREKEEKNESTLQL